MSVVAYSSRKSSTEVLALVFVFLWAVWLSPSGARGGEMRERLVVKTLENGMTFLVYPRRTSPTFAARLVVDVGSSDEHLGITGVAHLFEHMAFKGTTTIGTKDYEKEKPLLDEINALALKITQREAAGDAEGIEALRKELQDLVERHREFVKKDEFDEIYTSHGGQGMNATTSRDFTNYFLSLPANRLELWMWMESERLLHPVPREFYTERDVILEERNMRVENRPMGKLWETYLATAYQTHPYGYPVLGWPDDMRRLTMEKAEEFRRLHYTPDNMVVALVGDLEPDEVFALAERYFGRMPKAEAAARAVPAAEREQIGERRFEIVRKANPMLLIGYHKPAIPHRADEVADVIKMLLTDGRTSRMYKALVLEKQIAASVGSFTFPGDKYDNIYMFSAMPRAPHTVDEVEAAIYEEIERLAEEGPTERELQRVINNLDADLKRSLRSNSGLASLLSYFTILTRDPYFLEAYIERMKTVTGEEIQEFIGEYLVKENRTVGWIRKEEQRTKNEEEGTKK